LKIMIIISTPKISPDPVCRSLIWFFSNWVSSISTIEYKYWFHSTSWVSTNA
jgi:hypothetical protein